VEFLRRARIRPARLGILPGTFNPITVAHLALAEAALPLVDEVVFVLPRVFPHKDYSGPGFRERLELVADAAGEEPAYSIASSRQGLFMEIAGECREAYGTDVRLTFLCGRDAAERIVSWDYGRPGALEEMFRLFDLLVASREGEYSPPRDLANAIAPLPLGGQFDLVSATEVRRRIARNESWTHLVPPRIASTTRTVSKLRKWYSPTKSTDNSGGT